MILNFVKGLKIVNWSFINKIHISEIQNYRQSNYMLLFIKKLHKFKHFNFEFSLFIIEGRQLFETLLSEIFKLFKSGKLVFILLNNALTPSLDILLQEMFKFTKFGNLSSFKIFNKTSCNYYK
jgi:hypothetical protein